MTLLTKRDFLAVVSLVMVIGGAYWATLQPGQDWGGDFGQYITHARNIAEGRPYLQTRYEVTLPTAARHMPPSYPPVFPLLLAPVYARFGLNLTPMKIEVQILFLLAALAYYLVGRLRGLGPPAASIASGALALSGLVLAMKDHVLSDSTYLLFVGVTLSVMLLIERNKWDERKPVAAGLLLAILMLLAYGTRAIGGALAIAFVLHELLVKRRIRLFALIVLGGFAAGVLALTITLYDSRAYGDEFVFLPKVYLDNALFYLRSPAALWTGAPGAVRYLLFAITGIVVAAHWIRRMLTRPTVVEFQDLVIGCTVIVMTAGADARYLIPFFAMYFVYFLEGIEALRGRFRTSSWLPVAACGLLAVGVVFNLRGIDKHPYQEDVEQPQFMELRDFLRREVDPQALVISRSPRVLALYTDRRSAWYPETSDDGVFNAYLDRVGAGYVLVHIPQVEDQQWLEPHIDHDPADYSAVFRNAGFVLYRRISSP